MAAAAYEVNFDGLIGPTHNFAGLAEGNLASARNRGRISNPRAAALQGLEKMRLVSRLGGHQAILPPQERPHLEFLRRLGFAGSDERVVEKCAREAPGLLALAYSASSMWTANAATVCPGADGGDGRVHITPANLAAQPHRALEPERTADFFRRIFGTGKWVRHHRPLPPGPLLGDEGAANHMRLAPGHGDPGLQVFVYGRRGAGGSPEPRRYPARQTLEASQAVARLHGLPLERTLFLRQNPAAIDAGVFHNDVIAVSHRNLLLAHERAFAGGRAALREIGIRYRRLTGMEPHLVTVPSRRITVSEAVSTYLFNSQLADLPGGGMALLAARECRESRKVRAFLESLSADPAHPVREVHYVDLRQSMRNGGGPACLRLRVVLTEEQKTALHQGILAHEGLLTALEGFIRKRYRDRLHPSDLGDPEFMRESRETSAGLARLLGLDGP